MTYSAGNEQLNINSIAYEYDLNGNRIRKTEGGVVTNYTYDDENRLRQVIQGSTTITYTYDPFGRRIEKNINGTVRQYLYDNEDIILECATTGTVLARYTHGPGIDEPLAVQQGTALYYYHADALGSIAGLSNASGSVVQRYNYDSFGKFTQSGSVTQPYLFTAREYDYETGLYYYRARYYDPKAGRFITRDPIGFGGGINQYAYVGNNPVNRRDPIGKMPLLVEILLHTLYEIIVLPHNLGPEPDPRRCDLISQRVDGNTRYCYYRCQDKDKTTFTATVYICDKCINPIQRAWNSLPENRQ